MSTTPKMFAVTIYFSAMTANRRPRRIDQRRDFAVVESSAQAAIEKAWSTLAHGEFSDRGMLGRADAAPIAQEITMGILTIEVRS